MNYAEFESWLKKLDPTDRKCLEKKPEWKKGYKKARGAQVLPKGFAELSMEILEGSSESET